ncbi:MAG: TonB-dependent receptor [Bryobacterales bacterium]|nr:TonB-dependent receptor [Bryobacteraceae bacterium]MDW8354411.1 TonB-dependent receptor [Bryobacterales bacterium]
MKHLLATFLVATTLAAGETLRLRVLDPLNAVVPQARVEVRPRGGQLQSGATDELGEAEFSLELPAEVRVSAPGFEPVTLVVRSVAAGPEIIRLRPEIIRASVDIVVRDEPDSFSPTGTTLDIERTGARTVLDAVDRLVPGAFVTRRGVMGYGIATNGTGAISIRGVGGSPNTGVLVVVDGRPDYMGLMGHPLPDLYPLSDAATVTVIEGPASVLYGSNAMGGVVEIKPWRPRQGRSTKLTAAGGSFASGQYHLSHGTAFERGWYAVHAGAAHTDGARPSSAFRSRDGTLTTGYSLSPGWRLSLEGRYGHFHVEDPGPVTAPLAGSYARVGRGGFTVGLDHTLGRLWGATRVYSGFGKNLISDGFRSTDRLTGGRTEHNLMLRPGFMLQLGGDVSDYGGRARNVRTRVNWGKHTLTSAAGFVRGQWQASRRARFHSGARYETNSQFGETVAPEFGAAFAFRENYSLGISVAKGYRNPTIRELFLFPAPNPALKPEHVWQYQAAVRARPRDTLSVSLTAYYIQLNNMILTLGRFPNLRLSNTGEFLNRGLELTARWRPTSRVSLHSGYAWLRSTSLPPLLPRHKFSVQADFDAGKAFLSVGAWRVGERFANVQRTRTLDAYTLGTLKLTVPVRRSLRFHAVVDNFMDQRYEVLTGYPMPGVNAMAGLTFAF